MVNKGRKSRSRSSRRSSSRSCGCGWEREKTTRVGKAINKQDTSRMSNINNKNQGAGASWGGKEAQTFVWMMSERPGRRMNGKWRNGWVTSGRLGSCLSCPALPPFHLVGGRRSEKGSLLIYAVPIAATRDPRRSTTVSWPGQTNGIWRQIENIYVLCKTECVGAKELLRPSTNNGNLLSGKSNFQDSHTWLGGGDGEGGLNLNP